MSDSVTAGGPVGGRNRSGHHTHEAMRTGWRYTATSWTGAIIVWLCGAALFFRAQWLSGFDRISGDDTDGRFIIYLHEHLFRWLRGIASFTSPPMFYPIPDVLSYSDALLLNLLPYASLRAAGVDAFLSHQLTLVLLTFLGYATFIGLLRYAFAVRYSLAIWAALLFVFSNIMFLKQLHPQLFAVYYLPAIALLALWSLKDFPRLDARLLGGVAAAVLLYAFLFSTAYYIAWGAGVVALMGAIPAIMLLRKELVPFWSLYRRPLLLLVSLAFVAFAIGLIPFAIIYGPLIQTGATREYIEALGLAPFPQDIINVSPWNVVWGELLGRIPDGAGKHFARWEAISSVTPAIAIATSIGAWYVWRRRLIDWIREPYAATFVIVAAFLFWISWLLTWRIGIYSGYWLIWHLVPGASGIRAAWRIGLVVNMAMVAALAVVLDRSHTLYGQRSSVAATRAGVLTSLFLALCAAEQINTFPVAQISRSRQLQDLAAISPPPDDCEAFFVEPVEGADRYATQISAMLISQRLALPTINGHSGYFPPGWSLFNFDSTYHESVRKWITLNGLSGKVCSLALPRGTWRPF